MPNQVHIIAKQSWFTAYHLKMTALVLMTIDHIALYRALQCSEEIYAILRILGRIAAPLFLYLITVSMQHNRNKGKYVFRLYLCCIFMGISNILLKKVFSLKISGNIYPTLFYSALFIFLLQGVINSLKFKNYKTAFFYMFGITIPFASCWLYRFTHSGITKALSSLTIDQIFLVQDLCDAILPYLFSVEFSVLFVLIGILFYLLKNRAAQCTILLVASFISFIGIMQFESYGPFGEFFMQNQYYMFLAVPFIYMYNGQKGRGNKAFFYAYYPIHQWILAVISKLA